MNRTALLAAMVMIPATALAGQTAPPSTPQAPAVTVWSVRNWTRAEAWRFFEPRPGGGDNEYVYAANRLQATVRRRAPRYDITAALQYVQFGGLPRSVPFKKATDVRREG